MHRIRIRMIHRTRQRRIRKQGEEGGFAKVMSCLTASRTRESSVKICEAR